MTDGEAVEKSIHEQIMEAALQQLAEDQHFDEQLVERLRGVANNGGWNNAAVISAILRPTLEVPSEDTGA